MKVAHVAPSFYPAHVYGGPIESVLQLCRHTLAAGCAVRVLTTNANGPSSVLDVATDRDVKLPGGLPVRYCARRMMSAVSPSMIRLLPSHARWSDVVHLTGVYDFPTIPTLLACRVLRKPVVWSPRGALQQWEGTTRRSLKSVWENLCFACAPRGLCMHVTSREEGDELRERLPGVRVAVIPNGVEVPPSIARVPSNGALRLVFLGRLDPKKGIENLLRACRGLEARIDRDWSLVVAGSGDPRYEDSLRSLASDLGVSSRVRFVGAVPAAERARLFENADLAVVPSHTENFGMVVVEALAHAVPVVASTGTPWEKLESVGCGLHVSNSPESLALAIGRMAVSPLERMGDAGREWMIREFDWGSIAARMVSLYRELAATPPGDA